MGNVLCSGNKRTLENETIKVDDLPKEDPWFSNSKDLRQSVIESCSIGAFVLERMDSVAPEIIEPLEAALAANPTIDMGKLSEYMKLFAKAEGDLRSRI